MLVNKAHDNTIRWREGERLDHLFERACDDEARTRAGADVAVSTDEGDVSFRELDDLANRAARYLRKQGVKAGDRIGILVNKSLYTYVALLAVLKNNAAFVPLDAGFPRDRIGFILSDADVKTVVTVSAHAAHVSGLGAQIVLLDTARAEIDAQDPSRPTPHERGDASDQLAYIIYTSGSTGNPKGVACEHPSACNFVAVAAETYGIRSDDRMYQGMTIAFDFSFEELWVPLVAGAALVPGRPDANLLGADLHQYLVDRRVTALACVPTLLATIDDDLPDLRFLLVSGEACPRDLVNRWHKPGRIFLNAYGPTEAAVTATITEVHPDKGVTIGGPLPTYTIVILEADEAKQVPDGGTGEICIAGIALARGYVNRDDLTEKAFIPDFLDIPNNPSGRIYRTGDLGRINEEGEIEFLGRIDLQVKVRGYRIELTEIESVFMEAPGVALAVVDTHSPEPGIVDLVAYYTLKDGVSELENEGLSELLRSKLPAYMIPSFIERLDDIPMLPSQKADRKKLPPPKGSRFVVTKNEIVAPRNEMEQTVAEALCEVLSLEDISVEDHFFEDLGAHSLLMAQLSAALRTRIPGATVSMRDIYLNPSTASLAALIATTMGDTNDATAPARLERRDYRKASNLEYYGCGFLQAATSVIGLVIGAYIFVYSLKWTFTPTAWLDMYARMLALGAAFLVVSLVLPVALKWLLIGRWTAQEFPVWGLRYFRFWLVKSVLQMSPMRAIGGAPLFNVYLRLLGAKIGKNVVILSKSFPVCTDLVSIGDNTILSEDTLFPTYRADGGYIETDSVTIGRNVFVGEGSVLDIDTIMEDDTQLGHASSVHTGQRLEAGKRYHGTPCVETSTNFNRIEPARCTALRKFVYFGSQIAIAAFVMAPLSFFLMYKAYTWYFGGFAQFEALRATVFPPTASTVALFAGVGFAALFLGLVVGVIVISVVPRIFNAFLEENKVYPLYGIHYFLFRSIKGVTNSKYFCVLFGDSSYIVYYLRCVGYDLSNLKQTGSNFGTNQKHDNPYLCKIGRGTMVSDGLAMMNAQMTTTSFRLARVYIRENTFVGNIVHYPPDGKAGENCLLASRVMVPIDGPVRENVGLLGSPAFEIPRTVDRDRFDGADDPKFLAERLPRKNARNIVGMASVLLVQGIYGAIAGCSVYLSAWLYLQYGIAAFMAFPVVFALFTYAYFVVHAQWSLRGRRMEPKAISIYEPYFWSIEHYWKRNEVRVLQGFAGTPFKNVMSRLLGVKVGKKVFDDGCFVTEKTMAEIGDYCTLNAASAIQCHSLEDAFFKSDFVVLRNGCTIGPNAYIQYGATLEENTLLDTNAYLMKGEVLHAKSTWHGNPARPA